MSGRRAAGLIAAGALALALSYPVGPHFPPRAFFVLSFGALVPAVLLIRDAAGDARRAFRLGFWYGAAANALVLYWMVVALWHFTPLSALGFLASVALLGLWTGVLFWFVVRLQGALPRVPLWATLPIAWTALEWVIGHQGDVRFPWLGLGTSLAEVPVLVQWADLAGARGITLWLAWCSVMLGEVVGGARDLGLRRVGVVVATVLLALVYGAWRMATVPVREVGVVGLVQPNEGYREKWDTARRDSVTAKLVAMSRQVLALARPDVVIWPEAALPGFLVEHPHWEAAIGGLARESHTPILTGIVHYDPAAVSARPAGPIPYYNAAALFDSTGQWRPHPVYAKHYLVPVTERVPFFPVRWFRRVPGLANWSGGFSPGRDLPVYRVGVGRFGVLICYESAFEDLPRAYRRQGADFLVNVTNDAWFGRTSAPYQHASHLVLRAIETRMGVARAANSGISEFVDPLGRVYAETRLDTSDLVADRLRTSDARTLYVLWGDWVGALVVLATLGFAGVLLLERWRSRQPRP